MPPRYAMIDTILISVYHADVLRRLRCLRAAISFAARIYALRYARALTYASARCR